MTYDWAKPGVKVVCVNDTEDMVWNIGKRKSGDWYIKLNEIYTIREVVIHPAKGYPLIRLNEIRRESMVKGGTFENGWNILRFRPLVEKKLPESLTCLLKNPKSVIIPDQFDYKKQWEPVE